MDLSALGRALSYLDSALDALEIARSLPDEEWDSLDPKVMAVLDCLSDVEAELRPTADE